MKTLQSKDSINHSYSSRSFLLVPLTLAFVYFALSPAARADCTDDCFANRNTVQGDHALFSLTTGDGNTATGYFALHDNTSGSANTATGRDALFGNTTGDLNTAIGSDALATNTTGSTNTAVGSLALLSSTGNTNIALGYGAGIRLTIGDNNIDIGNTGVAAESNTIRIGTQVAVQDHPAHTATYIAGISGAPVMGAVVKINAAGQLGTSPSAARFKDEIKPMDKASEAILALKPVTFRYKQEIDPGRIQQFGLVAEDVEKVNPALVARDASGKVYSVRYDDVSAMLLNEFLKEHRTVQEQGATITRQRKDFEAAIAQQQKQIEALVATVKEQATEIQKVSAHIEISKGTPNVVLNNP
jgi:trimeric autotransporter adhesin